MDRGAQITEKVDCGYAPGDHARLSHPYYLAVHTLLRYGNKAGSRMLR